ncbi:xyloside xylosyltransferase 1 [Leptonychotes weddellii]|uniref:Xyloside xylosyltransferase 1 n=1 Tax=Leptonychotes weddellii TaxID=9713 RepID=A0A7F8QZI4_LEPWE|nr:xyloside xylosyltransferase 1 [Leptonychotes weddellii]
MRGAEVLERPHRSGRADLTTSLHPVRPPLVLWEGERRDLGEERKEDDGLAVSRASTGPALPVYSRRLLSRSSPPWKIGPADCFTRTNPVKSALFPLPRHTFWQFRHENPKTRVGGPPPEGLPGFNSGVMLLNLEAMRQSALYGRLLEPAQVQQLADKYRFRGHLGDQDFFTMIGMEHPELFHVLDCTWNRQLCTWWRDHGYSDVFEAYFRCEGHVKIYHGNCNTPIPDA